MAYQEQVKALHPDWTYLLWTDSDMHRYVQRQYPDFYSTFMRFERPIMQADVFRYLVLNKMGGLYLDLDYELFRPFDLNHHPLVLPRNRGFEYGDPKDGLGNAIMASAPDHPFWTEVLNDLKENPAKTNDYKGVVDATGPGLLTRIYGRGNRVQGIHTPWRKAFHPPVPKGKLEYLRLKNDQSIYGLHHGWGSWKERLSWTYISGKIEKLLVA